MAALPVPYRPAAESGRAGQLAWGGQAGVAPAPRNFTGTANTAAPMSGSVLPRQRSARIAARRAFVEMKRRFIEAVASIEGSRGRWLRHQVRQTEAPVDLWLLRGAVYDALRCGGDARYGTRLDLHQALDSVFPDSGELAPFLPR